MSSQTPCSDVRTLQSAVTNIDGLSREALSQIAAVARTAEIAVMAFSGVDPASLAGVLQVIWRDAERLMDIITSEAEAVGCAVPLDPEEGEAA